MQYLVCRFHAEVAHRRHAQQERQQRTEPEAKTAAHFHVTEHGISSPFVVMFGLPQPASPFGCKAVECFWQKQALCQSVSSLANTF
jgi:hypothetical protein